MKIIINNELLECEDKLHINNIYDLTLELYFNNLNNLFFFKNLAKNGTKFDIIQKHVECKGCFIESIDYTVSNFTISIHVSLFTEGDYEGLIKKKERLKKINKILQ